MNEEQRAKLTEEERQQVDTFLAERRVRRHKMEILAVVYLGLCMAAAALLDTLGYYSNQRVILLIVAVGVVYAPVVWLVLRWRKKRGPGETPGPGEHNTPE